MPPSIFDKDFIDLDIGDVLDGECTPVLPTNDVELLHKGVSAHKSRKRKANFRLPNIVTSQKRRALTTTVPDAMVDQDFQNLDLGDIPEAEYTPKLPQTKSGYTHRGVSAARARPRKAHLKAADDNISVTPTAEPASRKAKTKARAAIKRTAVALPGMRGGAPRQRPASRFEKAVTPNPAIPLDDGVGDHLGAQCKVIVDQNNVPLDVTLRLPPDEIESEQVMRMQFLDTEDAELRYKIWCRKSDDQNPSGRFVLLGDGSLDDAWFHWYKAFTEHTGLLWIGRFGVSLPGYWIYLRPKRRGPDTYLDQNGVGNGWQNVVAPTVPPQPERINEPEFLLASDDDEDSKCVKKEEDEECEVESNDTNLGKVNAHTTKTDEDPSESAEGMFETSGYNCKIVQDGDGTAYDAVLLLTESDHDNHEICHLQAIENANGDFHVFMRTKTRGQEAASRVMGDGQKWGIYKWFLKTFREMTGVPWRNRHEAPPSKGRYAYLPDGFKDVRLSLKTEEDKEEDKTLLHAVPYAAVKNEQHEGTRSDLEALEHKELIDTNEPGQLKGEKLFIAESLKDDEKEAQLP